MYGTPELGYGEAVVDAAEDARDGYRGRLVRIASVKGGWIMHSFPHRVRRVLPAWGVVALLLSAPIGSRAPARAQDDSRLLAQDALGEVNWLWVVPRIELNPQEEWILSAYYSHLGSCELDMALLDREGNSIARARLKLVAGQPNDYRLREFEGIATGVPLTLVISGLRARPEAVAFMLTASPAGGCERELRGSWLQGDIEWVPGLKGKP